MKSQTPTTFTYVICTLLLASLSACSGKPNAKDSNEQTALKILSVQDEDILDLGSHPVPTDTAIRYIDSTNLLLKLDPDHTLNYLVDELSNTALAQFRETALAIHAAHSNSHSFVTAVKIWFTADSNKVNCLYEPLSLCSSDTGASRSYSVYSSNQLYVYSSAAFSNASTQQMAARSTYSNQIRLRTYPGSTTYRNFVSGSTASADAEALIYTFQEMDSVMVSNTSSSLKLWSYACTRRINDTLRTRHNIMLSSGAFDYNSKNNPSQFLVPFRGNLANHSRLCPPDCNATVYRVKQ